jgi:large subunit ribosomal protein L22
MAARAIQRGVRQSARKMRLVMDTIRGQDVNQAYALLKFSKKRAAKQVEKVLRSAVSNAEQDAQKDNSAFDVDQLYVAYGVVNEGQTLKRFGAAALGRATPIHKRTSTVEIRVAPRAVVVRVAPKTAPAPRPKAGAKAPKAEGKARKAPAKKEKR